MKRSVQIMMITLAATAVSAAIVFADDFNRVALVTNSGIKTSGRMFGVEIGMDESKAAAVLSRRLIKLSEYKDDGTCPLPPGHESVLSFVDLSWRRGNVCAGVVGGRVKTLGWRYNLFQM